MTSFNGKLRSQFENFYIKAPNQPKYLKHLYVDYIELIALFSNGNYVTVTDILDRLSDDGDAVLVDENEQESIQEIASVRSEINDENEAWVKSLFEILLNREHLFGKNYPFCINEAENDRIRLKDKLTTKTKLYIGLLLASCLSLFSKIQYELTSEFEIISYQSLKRFLPKKAITKQFGKNSDYTGNAISKIKSLANDMNIKVREDSLNNISVINNQERGLDLIAWIPFKDKIHNIIIILVQCACGKEWYNKKAETDRYYKYLDLSHSKPIHSLFIPYAIVESSTSFFQDDETAKTLIFCRERILEYSGKAKYLKKLDTFKAVEYCIDFEEDIV